MTITELIMSIPPPPPVLESDTSFEIVFHYDGAVITYLDKEEE
jgi:hypothetical protein